MMAPRPCSQGLRQVLVVKEVKPRLPRPRRYDPAVIEALRFCWVVQGTPCGLLLVAALIDFVPRLRAFSELDISDAMAAKLLAITPATIDRRLKVERGKLDPRGRWEYQGRLTAQGIHSNRHLGRLG